VVVLSCVRTALPPIGESTERVVVVVLELVSSTGGLTLVVQLAPMNAVAEASRASLRMVFMFWSEFDWLLGLTSQCRAQKRRISQD